MSLIVLLNFLFIIFLGNIEFCMVGNSRTVVLLGNNKNINPLKGFFTENPDYGYKLLKVFTLEDHKNERNR